MSYRQILVLSALPCPTTLVQDKVSLDGMAPRRGCVALSRLWLPCKLEVVPRTGLFCGDARYGGVKFRFSGSNRYRFQSRQRPTICYLISCHQ
ncbi:hypothetical protein GQ53DRAFT_755791 [Thozetella sp. PMI_491]|nr:hypothetical protein GQ53DRAFT_755791 [Thozetella sp. PMI_491]